MQEKCVQFLGQEYPLEEEMVTCSSILTWKIPWTEETDGLQSMGSQRVGHNRATEHACMHMCQQVTVSKESSRTIYTKSCLGRGKRDIHKYMYTYCILCPTLCNPMDCSLSGSSVHGILQARVLELVAMPSSRGSSRPRYQTQVSCIAGRFLTTEPPGKPVSVSVCV